MDSRIEDFLRILRQGAFIFACSAQVEFPNALEKVKIHGCKQEEIITIQEWK
jgi:hypothetical protein